jgi:hypothetical protein
MERYDKGESVQGCEGHDFLRVPGEGWRQLREQEVNRCGETRDEWLERLAKKYDVDNKNSFELEVSDFHARSTITKRAFRVKRFKSGSRKQIGRLSSLDGAAAFDRLRVHS